MNKKQKTLLWRIAAAAVIFAVALVLKLASEAERAVIVSSVAFVAAWLVVGYDIVLKSIRNIGHGQIFDENFLMVIASIGAMAVREFPEGAAVMLLFQIGEWFQSYAVGKSRQSITDLMELCPDTANVLRDGEIEVVDPYEVEVGETIFIKPGEKIPLDAIVIEGTSSLDNSSLTGETLPLEVSEGDVLLSGGVNLTGALTAKVQKEFGESTASKILELVENAADNKSKSEDFITRFARWYTPTVVICAFLLAILPPLFIEGADFREWIYRALTFLVISCPCALVISVPLSFFGGIGACSRAGSLVKGSNYLETLANVGIAVFDKTGTLTKGSFAVTEVRPFNCEKDELLETAVLAESFSNHPIAASLRECFGKSVNSSRVGDYIEVAGHGIKAVIDGEMTLVGNKKLLDVADIEFNLENDITGLTGWQLPPETSRNGSSGTVIYVAKGGRYLGYVVISDELKKDSKTAIAELKAAGIKRTVMLTGDNADAADAVAEAVGIDEAHANLLPQDKVKIIKQLIDEGKSSNKKVLFAGDGINDAPSLALADVGVAMGGVGSDAAIEAADIVLMTDELTKLPVTVKIARKTLRIAKENIVFAIAVKLAVLILGAAGFAPMWLAIFADVGVAIIAILNALRCGSAK